MMIIGNIRGKFDFLLYTHKRLNAVHFFHHLFLLYVSLVLRLT